MQCLIILTLNITISSVNYDSLEICLPGILHYQNNVIEIRCFGRDLNRANFKSYGVMRNGII